MDNNSMEHQSDEQIITDSVNESKSHGSRRLLGLVLLIALACLLVSGLAAYYAYNGVKDQAEAGTTLAQQVQDACNDPTKRTADLQNLCDNADKVVDQAPEAVKGDPGDQGDPGVQGPPPSAAQVANAVALYCAGGRCNGTNGQNASQVQVAQAVATYCNANGECQGPKGDSVQGDTGDPGATGSEGPQGPPPSDAQVQDAVANYCSNHNGCQGPAGPEGPQGPSGVVGIDDQCEAAPDGQVVADVNATYDAETRIVTIDCTYTPSAL